MDVETLKLIVKYVVSPLVTCLILLLTALACHYSKRYCKLTYPICALAIAWVLLTSQFSFSNWLLHPLEYAYSPLKRTDESWQTAAFIFVPGCYYYAKELPEVSNWPSCSLKRLTQAAIMAEEHSIPIIVTGGRFLHVRDVIYAEKAKAFLQLITDAPVIALPFGHNTRQELEAVIQFTGGSSVAVVTSATHMKRLLLIASKLGLSDIVAVPVEHLSPPEPELELNVPSLESMQNTERALYEYIGLLNLHWSSV